MPFESDATYAMITVDLQNAAKAIDKLLDVIVDERPKDDSDYPDAEVSKAQTAIQDALAELNKAHQKAETWESSGAKTNSTSSADFTAFYAQAQVLKKAQEKLDLAVEEDRKAVSAYQFRNGRETTGRSQLLTDLFKKMNAKSQAKATAKAERDTERDKLWKLTAPPTTDSNEQSGSTSDDQTAIAALRKALSDGHSAVQGIRDHRSTDPVVKALKDIKAAMKKDDAFKTKFDDMTEYRLGEVDMWMSGMRDQANWRE
ncbi:hypothetical protein BKA62DRAFT_108940 [Auriculariales sp. MPI-PUGE-AT-0066]|nr:hypothetical protein BKA62DRAFT_108940 [Auriculariales sp. MPI-PUGE-AT-0066]